MRGTSGGERQKVQSQIETQKKLKVERDETPIIRGVLRES